MDEAVKRQHLNQYFNITLLRNCYQTAHEKERGTYISL